MFRSALRRPALLFFLALFLSWTPALADTFRVAAAADLRQALPELVRAFEAGSGHTVQLSFGASRTLYRQIQEGAPFAVFLSADDELPARLYRDGRSDAGRLYAVGNLALVTAPGVKLDAGADWSGLAAALKDGRITRFAIANPDTAPYGRAAREALTARGLWEACAPHRVLGENVAQAAQFVQSGGAQAGLIGSALARAEAGRFGQVTAVPGAWHAPLKQALAVMKDAPPGAHDFARFVRSEEGRTILTRYGFTLP